MPLAAAAVLLQNLTLFHTNEFKYTSLGITDMNEGDAAGDLFFVLKARALPVECPGAYDCRDPELAANKLQITKVVVEVDSQYLQTAGLYAECNVNENTSTYTCECRGAPHNSCTNHTVGVQTVRSLPFFGKPKPGSNAPSWWRYNLAQLIGGNWWSTVGSGQCLAGTQPPAAGCSWRLVKTVKRVNKTCHDASVNKAVMSRQPACFAGCLQPTNTSSTCWVDCFFKAVLGPEGGTEAVTNTSAGIIPLADLLAMWEAPFASDDPAAGGCPALV